MNKPWAVMLGRGLFATFALCLIPLLWMMVNNVTLPLGVMLVFGIVAIFAVCLIPILWKLVRSIRTREWKKAWIFGIVAVGIITFDAWALYEASPKGGRTIAQLELPEGREIIVRHYRYGWFEYPTVRLYARDTTGTWTRFNLVAELVDPNSPSLELKAEKQEVEMWGVGTYQIESNKFIHADGGGYADCQLPPGIEPETDVKYREPYRAES